MKYCMIALKEKPSFVYCFFIGDYTNDYRPTCFIESEEIANKYIKTLGESDHLLCFYESVEDANSFRLSGTKEWREAILEELIERRSKLIEKEG